MLRFREETVIKWFSSTLCMQVPWLKSCKVLQCAFSALIQIFDIAFFLSAFFSLIFMSFLAGFGVPSPLNFHFLCSYWTPIPLILHNKGKIFAWNANVCSNCVCSTSTYFLKNIFWCCFFFQLCTFSWNQNVIKINRKIADFFHIHKIIFYVFPNKEVIANICDQFYGRPGFCFRIDSLKSLIYECPMVFDHLFFHHTL